jgi:hypothetical protein
MHDTALQQATGEAAFVADVEKPRGCLEAVRSCASCASCGSLFGRVF